MNASIQRFEFETETDDETNPTFRVVEEFTDSWGTDRVAIETPAPWDTPDEMQPANEIVKSLEWDIHHQTWDENREAWVLDDSGVPHVRERAEEAGYEWAEGREGREVDGTLAALCEAVEDGDAITVTYAKKNGNGEATRTGTVGGVWDSDGSDSIGLRFVEEDGKSKWVRPDDDGNAGIFSSGYYPFMGLVTVVEVESL